MRCLACLCVCVRVCACMRVHPAHLQHKYVLHLSTHAVVHVHLQAGYIPLKKIKYQFTLAIFSVRNSTKHLCACVRVTVRVHERERERERERTSLNHRDLIIKQNS